MPASTRLISINDGERLAALQLAGRPFFAPWDPARADPYFTVAGQQAEVENALVRHSRGEALPHVILDEDSQVVGRITFSGITYGAFQSCNMGYWVAQESNGRGFATDAVRALTALACQELGRRHRRGKNNTRPPSRRYRKGHHWLGQDRRGRGIRPADRNPPLAPRARQPGPAHLPGHPSEQPPPRPSDRSRRRAALRPPCRWSARGEPPTGGP